TAGSDGSQSGGLFQYWSGAAAATTATVAQNIAGAISAVGSGAGVTASNPSSGVVKITASVTGLAGNGITVATTISSGLSGAAFNGNLSGGASGTTSSTTFSTSTDSATASVNYSNEATALATAINLNTTAS